MPMPTFPRCNSTCFAVSARLRGADRLTARQGSVAVLAGSPFRAPARTYLRGGNRGLGQQSGFHSPIGVPRWNVAPRMSTQSSSPASSCHRGPSLSSPAVVDHSTTSATPMPPGQRRSQVPRPLACDQAARRIMLGRPGREAFAGKGVGSGHGAATGSWPAPWSSSPARLARAADDGYASSVICRCLLCAAAGRDGRPRAPSHRDGSRASPYWDKSWPADPQRRKADVDGHPSTHWVHPDAAVRLIPCG
jgi:hypothetical protein